MGGIIGTVVPVAEAQQLPFAFKSAPEAHKAIDGPLGKYIGEEMAAKGMYLFPVGGFDNGMRQVASISRAVVKPEDFAGMKIRVPPGQMMIDTFGAFGAQPVTTPANQIYDALKTGKVDSQENPLAILARLQALRTGEVCQPDQPHVVRLQRDGQPCAWKSLPADIKDVIERNYAKYVRLQRQEQGAFNASLRDDFAKRGLMFNEVDQAAFRARLPTVYATWKEKLGIEMLVAGGSRGRQAGMMFASFRVRAKTRVPRMTRATKRLLNSRSATRQNAPSSGR